jgi:hypothetical protein
MGKLFSQLFKAKEQPPPHTERSLTDLYRVTECSECGGREIPVFDGGCDEELERFCLTCENTRTALT